MFQILQSIFHQILQTFVFPVTMHISFPLPLHYPQVSCRKLYPVICGYQLKGLAAYYIIQTKGSNTEIIVTSNFLRTKIDLASLIKILYQLCFLYSSADIIDSYTYIYEFIK